MNQLSEEMVDKTLLREYLKVAGYCGWATKK